MNPLFAAAAEIEGVCADQRWDFCFIGGLAVLRWGEPRLTRDVDLTIMTGFGGEERIVDALLCWFVGRMPDSRAFALRHRTLLLTASNTVPLDVALGALPFEQRATQRATAWSVGDGVSLTTCSAEDLVVHKVFAGRDRDWLDLAGIVARRGHQLDQTLIWQEAMPLLELKQTPESAERLTALFERPPG